MKTYQLEKKKLTAKDTEVFRCNWRNLAAALIFQLILCRKDDAQAEPLRRFGFAEKRWRREGAQEDEDT
ncbi:hypothetical protein SLA2020_110090 [Shorea laevis]